MACRRANCKHSLLRTQLLEWVGRTGTGSKYSAVYRDGSASVDPLHALVVDHSDEVWSVGGLEYLPSEGFGSDVVALDVELCRRGRSRWRSCGSMTAQVNTWPRWSTGGPLPRLHVVRRALTNRTTTAGSGGCAESEAAAIVTKVTVGQYVKLQVWTTPCRTWPSCRTGLVCTRCSRRLAAPGTCPSFARAAEADALAPKAGCLRHDLDDARHCYAGWSKPMLAALHALVLRSERVLIVEDSRELALDPPHAIRLEGRPPNW